METMNDLVDEVIADLEDLKDEGGERLTIDVNNRNEGWQSLDVTLPNSRVINILFTDRT